MTFDIIRAWKDTEYRESLTPEQLASLPASPIGGVRELAEEELHEVSGGTIFIGVGGWGGTWWGGGWWGGGGGWWGGGCGCGGCDWGC
ncbi:mersacidin/lichenicidin family type 2 lantibiotic [Thermosporothrix hazakensis]|jgi:mersacidin/lichenicidin family type 2 lantibiotic|uniref:Mersacidin/lichenicidin family type 2 lantibiotic n=2 Tax=Thermosporothrix TaxID=768650 RepID=A0A326UCE7_THEHA|nr:mersacidin/lichenicidin family type 2 lantibiotic [Thermosporothrix hazakensis]PZW34478.1 mersacidin/lichenicidin family type 2 lantibiotic [Thermosporothrix hazakensis]BBH85600.1 hypothetical protein KTC_03510 [Thermosporothrix sp. COM3]GCE45972.1 hypothetical protein KTH_08410 [Thermosporothrix hazakensis]